jgi:hypothetical protein
MKKSRVLYSKYASWNESVNAIPNNITIENENLDFNLSLHIIIVIEVSLDW